MSSRLFIKTLSMTHVLQLNTRVTVYGVQQPASIKETGAIVRSIQVKVELPCSTGCSIDCSGVFRILFRNCAYRRISI